MDANPSLTSSAVLRSFLVNSAMMRLGVLTFLLILAVSERLNLSDPNLRFVLCKEELYTTFFVLGFALNIGYLKFNKRFFSSLFFFRFQMLADMGLLTWWVFLTGGVFSGFLLIYILAIFFYGKFLGVKISAAVSVALCISLFLISCVQFYYPHLWGEAHIRGSDLAYNFSLFTLALALITSLVFLGNQEDKRLLYKVVEQEAALSRAETLKFRIFDWIDSGLMALDNAGHITTINTRALDWLPGLGREHVVNVDFSTLFPEFAASWEKRAAHASMRAIVSSPRTGLTFGLKLTALPDNQGWLMLFSDITQIHKLELQLKEMEKLATIGELAAGLAHEMKNPLAGIKTSIQLLLTDDLEPEYATRLSAVIMRDIERLDFLLKDFLVFARPQTATPESVPLRQVVDEVLTPLAMRYPAVHISQYINDECVVFDRHQLHQVVLNICLNAFQALEEQPDPQLTLHSRYSSSGHILCVEDNGPGFAPDLLTRCFTPFVTTKASGTGLGLSIAQRLAAQNNAYLEIGTTAQGGAKVMLHIRAETSTETNTEMRTETKAPENKPMTQDRP